MEGSVLRHDWFKLLGGWRGGTARSTSLIVVGSLGIQLILNGVPEDTSLTRNSLRAFTFMALELFQEPSTKDEGL